MSERRAPYNGKPVGNINDCQAIRALLDKRRVQRQRNLWALAFGLLVVDIGLWAFASRVWFITLNLDFAVFMGFVLTMKAADWLNARGR